MPVDAIKFNEKALLVNYSSEGVIFAQAVDAKKYGVIDGDADFVQEFVKLCRQHGISDLQLKSKLQQIRMLYYEYAEDPEYYNEVKWAQAIFKEVFGE